MSKPNDSLPRSPSSGSFLYPHFYECTGSAASSAVFVAFTCTAFLLIVPACALVVYVGVQRWRSQRQASAAMTVSPADFLAYNIIAFEPIGLLGCVAFCCGMFRGEQVMMEIGIYTLFLVYLGRLLFQCLTCVEQYLAVIHPVTYLSLKTERGLRIRNASIGCVWVICLVMLLLLILLRPLIPTVTFFTFFAFGLIIIVYCSISVLCALIRPGPGDMGGDRKRVNESKKRAFYNISCITAFMFVKYFGLLVALTLHASTLLSFNDGCVLLMSSLWFCLPTSLLIPVMFLHRARKLPCFSLKGESE